MRKRWRIPSTRSNPHATPAPDLVNRQFTAPAPDRLWVADATRIPCAQGVLWLAAVRDAFSKFAHHLADHGITASMGTVGDSYDNALMENFWSTLKIELVYRHAWRTRDEAENAIFSYIDGWYNTRRIQKTGVHQMSTKPPGTPTRHTSPTTPPPNPEHTKPSGKSGEAHADTAAADE